jgi:hypothetical protein
MVTAAASLTEEPTTHRTTFNTDNVDPVAPFKPLTFGTGIGVYYGGIGLNSEYHVSPNLSATMGLGTMFVSDGSVGWSLGAKINPISSGGAAGLRFGAGYGLIGVETTTYSGYYDDYEESTIVTGPFMSIGFGPDAKSSFNGWDIDLLVSKIGADLSFGYHF